MKTKEELLKIYSAYIGFDCKAYEREERYNAGGSNKIKVIDYRNLFDWDYHFQHRKDQYNLTVKPILYSMDMLTKEIEHKGERFIPLIKLYGEEIVLFNARKRNAKIECKVIKTAHNEFDYSLFIDDKLVFKFATYRGQEVGSFFNKTLFITNPYRKYQKLLEWHFNVFGLDESEYIKKEK